MGLTTAGLNLAAYTLVAGNKLALGNNGTTPLTPEDLNYQDVSMTWSQDATEGTTAHMYAVNGVLTNSNAFYFNDADDETGQTDDGWGTITHVMVVTGDGDRTVLYSGEINGGTGVAVPQNSRPKFAAGAFSLTLTT